MRLKPHSARIVAIASVAATLVFATSAEAANIVVNTTDDAQDGAAPCSLREAIQAANENAGGICTAGSDVATDTISFDPTVFPNDATEEIDLKGGGAELVIADNLAATDVIINGPGNGSLLVFAPNFDRILSVLEGSTATISGLTILGGDLGGDAAAAGVASVLGGGISNAGTLFLSRVGILDNRASATASPTATAGAVALGAGIFNASTGFLSVDRSFVQGNIASARGGAGTTVARGGGIYSEGEVVLSRTTVDFNRAQAGSSAVPSPPAEAAGGGVWLSSSTFAIDRSTISSNVAEAASSTSGNVSLAHGAGISSVVSGSLELSTVAGNQALAAGPAPFTQGAGIAHIGGTLDLTSSTIADNGPHTASASTSMNGANLHHGLPGGTVTLDNTILADPRGASSTDCSSAATSNGHNLDEDGSCDLTGTGDLTGDPLLLPLLSNGGSTRTRVPAPGSPVIDQGSAGGQALAGLDQRGITRPGDFGTILNWSGGDGSDIGAVEVQIAAPTFTATIPGSPGSDDTPIVQGTALTGSTVRLYTDPACTLITETGSDSPAGTPAASFANPGVTVDPLTHDFATTFYATTTTAYGTSLCSSGAFPNIITYQHQSTAPTPPPAVTPPVTTAPVSGATGQRAAALKRCKKLAKGSKSRKRCTRRARKLPV
jgi:CSLREA domain-containing protein